MLHDERFFLVLFLSLVVLVFTCVGILMWKHDFSWLFNHPLTGEKGIWLKTGFGIKKVAEDTPENRRKVSRALALCYLAPACGCLIAIIVILAKSF